MDDILSSIRNILMEDNAAQQSVPQPAPQTEKKAEPVSAPAAELPPAINTADELNTADQDDVIMPKRRTLRKMMCSTFPRQ